MQKKMVMVKNSDIQVIHVVVVFFLILFFALDTEANTKKTNSSNDLTLNYYIEHNNSVFIAIPSKEKINNKQIPVEITCPQDITTYTDLNSCSSYISGNLNVQCPENSLTRLSWEMTGATIDASEKTGINQINNYTFNEGETTITYTVEDNNSNVTTCSFTVTIWDNQAPRLQNMPENIMVTALSGECSAKVNWSEPTATDNCSSSDEIVKEASISRGNIFPIGKTIVHYHAIDAMGNKSADQSFIVTVLDNEPPQLLLPKEISINCEDEIPASWQNFQQLVAAGGYALDNCDIDETSFHLLSETSDSKSCPLTITRTYKITDAHGNTSIAKFLINIAAPKNKISQKTPVLKSTQATIISTATGGDWNNGSSWEGGVVPQPGDDIEIVSGATITLTDNQSCNDILINGTLSFAGNNTLEINGNWTNNGSFSAGSGTVAFIGTTDATLAGSSTSDFENLIINKGNSLTPTFNVITSISSSNFTLSNGILKLSSGTTNIVHGFDIPSTGGIWVSGATLNTGDFSLDNNGLIRITSGTVNFGNSSGNTIYTQIDGTFEVTGGLVNIAGRLENTASGTLATGIPSGIHISGGTITLATVGNGLSNVGSLNVTSNGTFDFNGGTIIFQNPSTASTELDLGLISGNGTKNTVGGKFQFGNSSTVSGAIFNISSDILLDDLSTAANANLSLNKDLLVNKLNLGSNGIDLKGNALQLLATSPGTYNFPINDTNGNLIPVSISINGGSFASNAYVQVETTGAKHPENANTNNYLNRYWNISTSGITGSSYNITTTYANSDIIGSASEIAMGSWSGSLPWVKFNDANTSAHTLTSSGITSTDISFSGITSDPPTVVIDNGETANVCFGSSINLSTTVKGDPTITYLWNPSTGLSASTISNPIATPTSTTNYTVTVTDGNGFTASDDIEITIDPLPTASAGGSQSICSNGTATVSGASAANGTILWSHNGAGTITDETTLTPTYSATPGDEGNSVVLTMTVTGNNSCGTETATATYTVNVDPLPTASAGGSQTICSNGTATVSGASATNGTILWSHNGSGTIAGETTLTPTYTAGAGDEGNAVVLTMTVTSNNSCGPATANATYAVNVDPLPTASAGGSQTICSNGTATVIGASAANGTILWSHNGSGTIAGETTLTPTYTADAGDEGNAVVLTMTVTSDNSCEPVTANATYTVNVDPMPTASAGGSEEICAGGSVTVSGATADFGTIVWTHNGNGSIAYENSLTPTYISDPLDAGNTVVLTLTVTGQNTCSSLEATAIFSIDVLNCIPQCATKNICAGGTWEYTSVADFMADGGQINFPCNVPDVNINLVSSTSSGETCPQIITQTYEIWDECGNRAQCEAEITLEDTQAPVLSGIPADIDLLCENPPDPPELYTEITASDNCDNNVEITYEEISTQKFDNSYESVVYTVTRRWTATDDCGNSTYDEQIINVKCEYCSNMIDDDGDGLIDENDPKCPCSSPSYKLDCNANQFYFIPPVWQMNPSYGVYTDPSSLVISTPYGSANITIRTADGTTYNQSFTVNQGTALEVPLTESIIQTPNYNKKEKNRGLIIESDQLIQVVYRLTATNNKLMVTIKGEQALGQWFRVGSQTNVCGDPDTAKRENHFISVMAVEDNTTINFDFKADMKGLGSTHSVTLDAGETYLMIDNDVNQTVTGSLIVANKTIAVISGSQHSRQCSGGSGRDGGADQLVPTCVLGTNYVVSRGSDDNDPSTANYAVIVGVTSNTDVTIDGVYQGKIGPGEYLTYDMPSPNFSNHHIETSEPAYVYQFGSLQNNGEIGMAVVSPIDGCRGDRYIEFYKYPDVNVNNTTFIIPNSGLSSFTFNGNSYSSYGVTPTSIPGLSDWSTITFGESDMANYNIAESDEYFIAYQFVGDNAGGTMGYLTSFKDKVDIFHPDTGEKTYEYFVDTICAGQSYTHTIDASSCSGDQYISGFIGGGNTAGYKIYPNSKTFEYTPKTGYTGEDNVTVIIADGSGLSQPVCLNFYVCGDSPTITCPPNIVTSVDPGECFATGINPGIPTTTGGCFKTEVLNVSNDAPEQYSVGETIITWTVRDSCGNEATCEQTVTVNDDEPPTFNSASIENCVDKLYSAVYTVSSPNPNVGTDPNLIKIPSPDYYTFTNGNISLDVTDLDDNCCDPSSLIIYWQIDFTATPDPLNPTGPALTHTSISGTGQPSMYGSDMQFPGDGVYFTNVTHTITYRVEDCNGNISEPQVQNIVVTPRPQIIKTN